MSDKPWLQIDATTEIVRQIGAAGSSLLNRILFSVRSLLSEPNPVLSFVRLELDMKRSVMAAVGLVFLCVCAAIIVWRIFGVSMFVPTPTPEDMYPHAPVMPAMVSEPVELILAKYERVLADHAPAVLAAMQPGLSDAAISAMETANGFRLPADLRALYRWRNGTPRAAMLNGFPDHQFVPLEKAVAQRTALEEQVKAGTPEQRRAFVTFAGHRAAWLGVMVDLAGDGCFFDPGRLEMEGSFFFCFAEDGSYVFYPSVRNYLAAVVEGHGSGVFGFDRTGVVTLDFARAQGLLRKYGAENAR